MMSIKLNLKVAHSIHSSTSFSCFSHFTKELNQNIFSILRRYLSSNHSNSSSIELDQPKINLYPRLLRIPNAKDSVLPVLNKWVDEGNTVDLNDFRRIIKELRKSRRFKHSLEISEWMASIKYLNFTPGDTAVRLDLISKVHGLKQGEKYFDSIQEDSRSIHVYNALLNCYTRAMVLDKAEATLQKMRELGYAEPLAYSNMLKLYSRMGKHEKLNSLTQEIEDKGISLDRLAYTFQLRVCSDALDIARLEKLLLKMEADPLFFMDWDTYAAAANVFLKAGAAEKAKLALEISEQLIGGRITTNAYESLMSLFARLGNRNEVLRLWSLRKKAGNLHYSSYTSVITSLIKLNDLDSAEKLLKEWQAEKNITFDIRFANCLVKVYCGTGYTEKAESLADKLIEGGNQPSAGTWKHIILGYRKCKRMEQALDAVRKAITDKSGWKCDLATLNDCLVYLEGQGDFDRVKRFASMLMARGKLSREVTERLETYAKEKNVDFFS